MFRQFVGLCRVLILALPFLSPALLRAGEAAAAPAPDRVLAGGYEHPVLDPQAVAVDHLDLSLDRMTLKLGRGRAAVVRVSGVPAGLFFCGEGTVSYLSTDPSEQPVLKYNLKRNTSLEPKVTPEGLRVEDGLKAVLVWFGGQPVPALSGAPAEGLADEFREQRGWFAFRAWNPVGNLMALRAGNAPDRRLVVAEVTGRHHKGVFLYDDALTHKEAYAASAWRDTTGAPAITDVPLSETFLQGSRSNPLDPEFLLTQVDLDLEASRGSAAQIHLTETVVPLRPNLRMLKFNLDSEHLSYDGGKFIPNPVHVTRVTTESGTPVAFEHLHDGLLLAWPTALTPSQPIRLRFEISGNLLMRHGEDDYWELGTSPWFPQPDLPGQTYTVHLRMAVDNPFIPVAPGRVVKQEATATQHILETVMDKPVCFLAVGAGKYEVREFTDPRTAVKLRLYGYSGLSSSQGERLAKTIQGFISFYQTFLGPYPFQDIAVVERNELGHGQAPPGLVLLTREAFNPLTDEEARAYAIAWINQGVAHEVAHQYWGIQVRMFDPDAQWITEAFSEYCAALAMRQMKGTGKDRFDRAFARWTGEARTVNGYSTISHANWLRPVAPEESGFRQYSMYDKGALLLAAIHKELGDNGFAQFLNAYQQQFAWHATLTQDVPDLLKRLTGRDWEPFFKKFFWGSELPSARP